MSAGLVLEPLGYGFFLRGILAAVLVMLLGALSGPSILARRQAFLGQSVGQSMLLGSSVAAVSGLPLQATVLLAALLAASFTALLASRLGADVSIALVAALMLSLGIVVVTANRSESGNVSNVLFGNVLAVSWTDILSLALTLCAAGGFLLASARNLALLGVSRDLAAAHGVKVRTLELAQTAAVAAAIAAFVQVAGTLLALAAVVLPAATAQLLARKVHTIHLLAAVVAVLGSVVGLYVSYWFDLPSGPSIALVLVTQTLFAASVSRR